MSNQRSIATVQSEIEQALESLPSLIHQLPSALKPLAMLAPQGFRVQVSLRRGDEVKKSRQVKSNATFDEYWSAKSDGIWIAYEVRPIETVPPVGKVPTIEPVEPAQIKSALTSSPDRDLLRTLAKAENVTQFVSLKWFRDTFLPQQGYAWAVSPEERHRILSGAIERRWILLSKVANPKNPQFPVTAIRANRPLAEVREILEHDADMRSTFMPVAIPGESLSQTVLSGRR